MTPGHLLIVETPCSAEVTLSSHTRQGQVLPVTKDQLIKRVTTGATGTSISVSSHQVREGLPSGC